MDYYISDEGLYDNNNLMFVGYFVVHYTFFKKNFISNLDLYIRDVFDELDYLYLSKNEEVNYNNIYEGYTIIKIYTLNKNSLLMGNDNKFEVDRNNIYHSTLESRNKNINACIPGKKDLSLLISNKYNQSVNKKFFFTDPFI